MNPWEPHDEHVHDWHRARRLGEIPPERIEALGRLQMLVVIIDRSLTEKASAALRARRMPGAYAVSAKGTGSSSLTYLFGLDDSKKVILLTFVMGKLAQPLIKKLDSALRLTEKNTGIAFTVPLTGLTIPRLVAKPAQKAAFNEKLETEVNEMNEKLMHDLVLVMVDEDHIEDVMGAARAAGATGGTTFHALHFGAQDMARFFGYPMQSKKDVVAILVKREDKLAVMQAIDERLHDVRKLLFALPADNVIGMGELEAEPQE